MNETTVVLSNAAVVLTLIWGVKKLLRPLTRRLQEHDVMYLKTCHDVQLPAHSDPDVVLSRFMNGEAKRTSVGGQHG